LSDEGGQAERQWSSFAEALRTLRARAGLSPHELAERSGLHMATILDLERGGRPRRRTAEMLANALGLQEE
jgi:transcriptional regulator with XRE-family HTH domain